MFSLGLCFAPCLRGVVGSVLDSRVEQLWSILLENTPRAQDPQGMNPPVLLWGCVRNAETSGGRSGNEMGTPSALVGLLYVEMAPAAASWFSWPRPGQKQKGR